MILTRERAEEIYTILVEECGATDDHMSFDRDSFTRYMTGDSRAKEYRFQGALGFGGKCRTNSNHLIPYVDYYSEDYSVARDNMVDRANERIAKLLAASEVGVSK